MSENKKTAVIVSSVFAVIIIVMALLVPVEKKHQFYDKWGKLAVLAETDERAKYITDNEDMYPQNILELYYYDEDKFDFVYNYPFKKDNYKTMSFTEDELNCSEIPAIYMKDTRWAYEDDCIVSTNGCSAVSLTMANLYLNHNSDIDPVKIMQYIYENDYVGTWGGLSAKYAAEVYEHFGFECVEHAFDNFDITEEELKSAIDKENVVIMAGMSGENFGGHVIVIRGYDENGFYINDPANEEKTAAVWSFEDLGSELVRYWELSSGYEN